MNEVVLGTLCGVLFGPYGANIFNPREWGDVDAITLEVTRITLAAGLFTIGVELPQSYLKNHAKGLLIMVVPTMAFGWIVVACATYITFIRLDFISSLVVAACLTPTDPIISAAIVGGRYAREHVPVNLRHIIAAESAANDGLAYPFISLSIYLTTQKSTGVAFGEWILVGCLYQVVLGTIIGAGLGLAFSYLMKLSYRKGFIDRESYLAQYLALTLFTVGITRTLGSDDLLAAFAAGSALNWDGYFSTHIEGEVFSAVVDLLLNCGTFVYIGAWMPFASFNAPELGIAPWRLVILFLAILCLRRIPVLLVLYRWVPEISTWKEALFTGHFGQMGVGAIFTSSLTLTQLPKPHSPPQGQAEVLAATLQPIVAFVVLGSIVIHGLSVPCFSVGRSIGARTLSLSKSWTLRNASATPDWLLWVRRASTVSLSPPTTEEDVERADSTKDLLEDAHGIIVVSAVPPLAALPEKIQVKQHANVHVALGTPALVSSTGVQTSPERPAPPLPEKDSRMGSSSHAPVPVQAPSVTRTADLDPSHGSIATSFMDGADRPFHIAGVDNVDEQDEDLAESAPVSLYGLRFGEAFPSPIDVADGDLDLASFVAQLRTRGARTVSSPSVRAVHFPEDAAAASDGDGDADGRE
ncbi:hypothetical protein L227DRAFT_542591 [Lentinus tigrinus ALCF2SS1-6]|uniref:Cation/H+ exchanger transmembrane domain-containing protein n=1 Tax=Lentinus tigrinus ALCF2SS1-6 TaxID=1328759 RepID=A0A5C2SK64_9APHY|nr:hypothetical protein L227DRAFT_542591 [Lentinus tigrinus ALCF2SS1-6]